MAEPLEEKAVASPRWSKKPMSTSRRCSTVSAIAASVSTGWRPSKATFRSAMSAACLPRFRKAWAGLADPLAAAGAGCWRARTDRSDRAHSPTTRRPPSPGAASAGASSGRRAGTCLRRVVGSHSPRWRPCGITFRRGRGRQRFWVYRSGDGMDPDTGTAKWFLHGIFADEIRRAPGHQSFLLPARRVRPMSCSPPPRHWASRHSASSIATALPGSCGRWEAAKETGVRLVVGCRLDLQMACRSWSIRRTGQPIRG
jgi:hypothetical protein